MKGTRDKEAPRAVRKEDKEKTEMTFRAKLTIAAAVTAVLVPVLSHAQLFTLTKEQMIELTAQNPFERFPDGRPKVPDGLIERTRGLSAEEVFAVLPGKNFRNQYAHCFQILHPNKMLVGRAFTVQ